MAELHTLRAEFPALQKTRDNKVPVYFDSACTSLKPQKVIDAITQYYSDFSACAGRSDHWFAQETQQKIHAARETIKNYVNASRVDEVVFTKSTTESINLLAHQLDQKGGIVVVSDKEHNSNFLPWQRLAENGNVQLKIVETERETGAINIESLRNILGENADCSGYKLVSTFHTSNLDGSIQNVQDISRVVKEHDFLLHIDAAQAIPHSRVDMQKLHIDFLSFSGHKVLGPTGIGVLVANWELLQEFVPFVVGGGTPLDVTYKKTTYAYPPQRLEAGIQHYAGIIGLSSSLTYVSDILENHSSSLVSHANELNTYISNGLASLSDRIHIIGPTDIRNRPTILSFTLEGMHHQQVAQLLDTKSNIMVRAGRHCVHGYCNANDLAGTIRLSFYFYNTKQECAVFLETMEEILKI